MNVRDTLSHEPNMVSQCQTKKTYWPDTNLHRQMDGQTDRQTHRVIPIYPPELRSQGLY